MKKPAKVNNTLKRNQIVEIYTDFKEQKGYEGKAILLEKISTGDSFYLKNESILPGDKKEYTTKDYDAVHRYNRLKKFFYGNETKKPNKRCIVIRTKLIAYMKSNDYVKMDTFLNSYRNRITNDKIKCPVLKDLFSSFNNDYIINFTKQYNRTWSPSIYIYERWKVQFIEDNTGWETNFVTNRNIRIMLKWNPDDKTDDISMFTTYNGLITGKQDADEAPIPKGLIKDRDRDLDWIFPRKRKESIEEIQDKLLNKFCKNEEDLDI